MDAIKKRKISSCQELNPDTPPTGHSIELLYVLQDYRLDAASGHLVRKIICIVFQATLGEYCLPYVSTAKHPEITYCLDFTAGHLDRSKTIFKSIFHPYITDCCDSIGGYCVRLQTVLGMREGQPEILQTVRFYSRPPHQILHCLDYTTDNLNKLQTAYILQLTDHLVRLETVYIVQKAIL